MTKITQNKNFSDYVLDTSELLVDTVEWIRHNLKPEDVFSKEDLEEWALDSGWSEDE